MRLRDAPARRARSPDASLARPLRASSPACSWLRATSEGPERPRPPDAGRATGPLSGLRRLVAL